MSDRARWPVAAVAAVLVITAVRLLLLRFNDTDLLPGEIALWAWAAAPPLPGGGAPPLAGWLVGLATIGSDAPFRVRLPAPLLIGATALILGAIADRLLGARAAWLAAIAFVTLPGATLASQVIGPETVMAPFIAGSLALYLRLLDRREDWAAAATGLLLGLAVLGDWRALAFPLGAALAATVFHEARPSRRHGALIALVAGAAILPYAAYALWTAPGASMGFRPVAAVAFVLWQAAVLGPILFAALVLAAWRAARQAPVLQFLLLVCAPAFALGLLWAMLFGSVGWTAALAGLPVAAAWLARRSRAWLAAAHALNLAASAALPLAALAPGWVDLPGPGLLSRHVGRAEMSRTILDIGRDLGIRTIVAPETGIRLDLLYEGRGGAVAILPRPAPGSGGDVLLVQPVAAPVPCPEEAMELAVLEAQSGAYAGDPQRLSLVPVLCLGPEAER